LSSKTKVLYVLPNHPSLHPGGPETYALELYEAMRDSAEFEPILLARMGSEGDVPQRHRPGDPFSSLEGDPNQYLVLVEREGFDFFYMTYGDKSLYNRYLADFLRFHKPDIVHFHDSLFLGCELISLIRNLLPATPIVYTLHDYAAICHRDGKLVRTVREELCLKASPHRCHQCFHNVADEDFFLRQRFIQAHFSRVDRFLAPSNFLLERYLDWGIPAEKLRYEEYGRPPARGLPDDEADRPRTSLAYFGELSPYKGVETLIGAMQILRDELPELHLSIHGANLWRYPEEYRARLGSAIEEASANVTFVGSYDRGDLPRLMGEADWVVLPSRWWENSPLVVQEAFQYRRPVICSGIGGMAEKVTHGVNGLHFTVSNPEALAETIRRAVTTPGLWEELWSGIPPVYGMPEHVESISGIYRECLESTRGVETPALSQR
jgi:glycosyltransferase involved in cell wall biosynthesis